MQQIRKYTQDSFINIKGNHGQMYFYFIIFWTNEKKIISEISVNVGGLNDVWVKMKKSVQLGMTINKGDKLRSKE